MHKISILINFVKEISISVKSFYKNSTGVRMFEKSGFYQQLKKNQQISIFIKIFKSKFFKGLHFECLEMFEFFFWKISITVTMFKASLSYTNFRKLKKLPI